MTRSNVHELSAAQLSALYAKLEVSPVEVVQALYERIARLNPTLNCFSVLDYEAALKEAKASEQRWQRGQPQSPIDGVPTTIKDSFAAKGWPTLMGSQVIDPHQPWDVDAPVTQLLHRAGAVLLGKTTMPEFGWKGVTENTVTGITRNPWNLDKTCGGSSGGAASGVAGGLFPLAMGSDGGGSIRIPASFCGVFGLKPTRGLVPLFPPAVLGNFVQAGPITRTVEDAAMLMDVTVNYDVQDCYSIPSPTPGAYRAHLKDGIAGLNIAMSRNLGYFKLEPAVERAFESVAGIFEALGATITWIDPLPGEFLPNPSKQPGALERYLVQLRLAHLLGKFKKPWLEPDFLTCFNTYWGLAIRYVCQEVPREKRHLLDSTCLYIAKLANSISATDYMYAQTRRRLLTSEINLFFNKYDLLLTPTLSDVAFNVGQDAMHPELGLLDNWTPFTCLFNLTGHPAASIPCGVTDAGLPVGLQVVGAHFNDLQVLKACYAFEQAYSIKLPTL